MNSYSIYPMRYAAQEMREVRCYVAVDRYTVVADYLTIDQARATVAALEALAPDAAADFADALAGISELPIAAFVQTARVAA